MKVAVVGSRGVCVSDELLACHLANAEEIVSGAAKGVDRCAAAYAKKNGIPLTEFLPQYEQFGRGAPIVRNKQIVDYADQVLVFWDGCSKGTQSVIKYAQKVGKTCRIVLLEGGKIPNRKMYGI